MMTTEILSTVAIVWFRGGVAISGSRFWWQATGRGLCLESVGDDLDVRPVGDCREVTCLGYGRRSVAPMTATTPNFICMLSPYRNLGPSNVLTALCAHSFTCLPLVHANRFVPMMHCHHFSLAFVSTCAVARSPAYILSHPV